MPAAGVWTTLAIVTVMACRNRNSEGGRNRGRITVPHRVQVELDAVSDWICKDARVLV